MAADESRMDAFVGQRHRIMTHSLCPLWRRRAVTYAVPHSGNRVGKR